MQTFLVDKFINFDLLNILYKGGKMVRKIAISLNGREIKNLFVSILRALFIIGVSYVILFPLLIKISNQ